VKVPSAPVPEPAAETTAGALALATESVSMPETAAGLDLDRIRDTVTAALDSSGHNTAAVLLANGKWREKNGAIEVEVGLRKTMLSLTMNAEAEKICREALRSVGLPPKITFISGEGVAQPETSRPKPALSGSVQSAALDHPLVKQAQELFQAEVRSVLDLRDKK
jgi:DNA polymerase-3 subunit gamma/tau